jgi:hypothetical protein
LLCEVNVRDASNIDWEDVALDDAGNLYVGDFGNNQNNRRNLEVLVIREPNPGDCVDTLLDVGVSRRIPFYFPEQTDFPNPAVMNFDCEALFWLEGSLYVFTKHRSDSRTVLYRLPEGSDGRAVRLGEFDALGQVTAASVSEDGRWLVVLTYDYVHLFALRGGVAALEGLTAPDASMLIEGRQCEAICFDGDTIVIANEQREIYRIPLSPWHDVLLPAVPLVRVAPIADAAPELVAWATVEPQQLLPEVAVGTSPAAPEPQLRLTRSAQALYLQIDDDAAVRAGAAPISAIRVLVGPGEARKPRQARPEDLEYQITRESDGWSVQCRAVLEPAADDLSAQEIGARDQAHGDAAVVHFDPLANVLSVRLPLESHLVGRPKAPLRANLIVRRSAGAQEQEWAWGGTSSTRPWENVLLWGRLEGRSRR